MADLATEVLESSATQICVIAAPGSGKTTSILIPKANKILQSQEIDPKEVLILTFSRMSAMDLRNRAKAIQRMPRASTVHSFCLSFLLSEDNHEIRKRVDAILLEFEKETLLSDLKIMLGVGKRTLQRQLNEFSAGWATRPHGEVFEQTEEQRRFKAGVVKWLSEYQTAMMEEIVYGAVDLARKVGKTRFLEEPKYIFVDEFQDLNQLEQEFIELLATESKLLLIVGDPDQSIYSFKYAHPEGIRAFANRSGVTSYRHMLTRRCPKAVVAFANQILQQAEPGRRELLQSPAEAHDGEMHFIRKETQEDEFGYLISDISRRLQKGVGAAEIIVLAPRVKLGAEFTEYANQKRADVGISPEVTFTFVLRPDFNEAEKEKILLFGLLARPGSLVHMRCYLGLPDRDSYSRELRALKDKYGSLVELVTCANPEEWARNKGKARALCERIVHFRRFVEAHTDSKDVGAVLDELFPPDNVMVGGAGKILEGLREDGDTLEGLYAKFVDYIRTLPVPGTAIRVMTLRASKGLDADHIYILGCNAGNIPGRNRSAHIDDNQHKEEQRRLLYVGMTRAKRSLSISWSRYIPFRQAKGHHTGSVGTIRREGEVYSKVGICEFLQDLSGTTWET